MLLPKQRLAFVFQSNRSEFLKNNSNVRLLPVATFSFLFALLYLKEWVAAIHECIHLPLPVILNNLKLGYQRCLKQYALPRKLMLLGFSASLASLEAGWGGWPTRRGKHKLETLCLKKWHLWLLYQISVCLLFWMLSLFVPFWAAKTQIPVSTTVANWLAEHVNHEGHGNECFCPVL